MNHIIMNKPIEIAHKNIAIPKRKRFAIQSNMSTIIILLIKVGA